MPKPNVASSGSSNPRSETIWPAMGNTIAHAIENFRLDGSRRDYCDKATHEVSLHDTGIQILPSICAETGVVASPKSQAPAWRNIGGSLSLVSATFKQNARET